MYRITVLTTGKFNTVGLGSRYCLTKKTAKSLIKLFFKEECTFKVEKFTRLHHDIFAWIDDEYKDSVFEYYTKVILKEE